MKIDTSQSAQQYFFSNEHFFKRIFSELSVTLDDKIMEKQQPHIINPALLWEYDLTTFNYEKSYKIVIERVLQLGNLDEWRNMVSYYSSQQILDTIE